ncbi:MAG TPA: hypothetical protein VI031_05770 [Pyrinomonadaceae bacterium]
MIDSKSIRNPFPGLRPFETDEYRLFFGREGQADELIARLQRSRFLAVVGTSGSGKSSLIRAGLMPALRGGMMAEAGSGWRIAVMRPGGDPIGNLAAELAKEEVLPGAGAGLRAHEAEALIDATLRGGSLGIVDVARQGRMSPAEKLLVVVDQFEEVFRFRAARESTSTADEASAFVKLLLEASRQRELPIYIVLTMRSDFLGDCAQFQGLPEAINEGQYLIPRMTRDERRFAVTGPVGVTRGKISEPLVNRLLNDVGDNPDQLPILQHALMRTWEYWQAHRRDGEPIGIEHYEAIGTMSDALSRHADEAFNQLPDERSRVIAEKLFKALSERGVDNREIRHPTRLDMLCRITGASMQEIIAVIDIFRGGGRSFLMPPAGTPLQPETVIDISHESLIRNWQRLKVWVNEEAQSARIYRRVAETAVLHGEGSEGLMQDPALQFALDWREQSNPNAAWAQRYHPEFEKAIRYLDDSRMDREKRIAAEELRRNQEIERDKRELEQTKAFVAQQARSARRLRLLIVALCVILLFAVGTAAYAFRLRSIALNSTEVALYETKRALASAAEAEEARKVALAQTEVARASESAAVKAEKQKAVEQQRAKEEAERADKAARLAAAREAEARQATEQQKAATEREHQAAEAARRTAETLRKSKEANEKFRESIVTAQRGSYADADNMLAGAIEIYRDKVVLNREAEADALVQRGYVRYKRGYQNFVTLGGNLTARNRTADGVATIPAKLDVDETVQHFDSAVKMYESIGSKSKAAATLFSLGTILMRFASEVPAVRGMSRADLADLLTVNSAESETPDFSVYVRAVPFTREDLKIFGENEKLKEKYRDMAVERFEGALKDYQQTYDEMTKVQREIPSWLRAARINSAFQVADISLRDANRLEEAKAAPDEIVRRRRKAISYLERMLSFYEGHAGDYAYLLVWLRGLYLDLGDTATADSYLEKAVAAYTTNRHGGYIRASALSAMADVAVQAQQWRSAGDLYRKALAAHKTNGDLLGQTSAQYGIGWVYENEEGGTSFESAIESYRQAVAIYKQSPQKDPELAKSLLHIGQVARGVNDYDLAVQAFDLSVASASGFTRNDIRRDEARAYAEAGAMHIAMKQMEKALESYTHALEIYTSLASSTYNFEDTREDAEDQVERIGQIVKELKSGNWKAQGKM